MAKLNKEQVLEILQKLFRQIAPEVSFSDIDLNAPLRDQVEIDSYDFINLLVKVHEQTGVNVPDSEVRKLQNLGELADYIARNSQ